jgi:hypothetical protein
MCFAEPCWKRECTRTHTHRGTGDCVALVFWFGAAGLLDFALMRRAVFTVGFPELLWSTQERA